MPAAEAPALQWPPLADIATPEEFGAAGDGLHDDTAAIQRAMASGKKAVYFTRPAYAIEGTVEVPSSVTLVDGLYAGVVRHKTGRDVAMFRVAGGAAPLFEIRRLYVVGAKLVDHASPREVAVAGTITKAGARSNMVPDETVASYTVRSQDLDLLNEWAAELKRMAEGAALMTGTEVEVDIKGRYQPTNPCFELSDAYLDAMAAQGLAGTKSHEKDLNFAATDFGNFSQLRPGVHMHFPVFTDEPCHSKGFAAACNAPAAYESMLKSGAAMAATALRYIGDAAFREKVNAEFSKHN